MNLLIVFGLAILSPAASLDFLCSRGSGVLSFTLEPISAFRNKLVRSEKFSDSECRGELVLAFEQSDNIFEFSDNIFARVPGLLKIEVINVKVSTSKTSWYEGTNVEELRFQLPFFTALDESFFLPSTVRKLTIQACPTLESISPVFFDNHPLLSSIVLDEAAKLDVAPGVFFAGRLSNIEIDVADSERIRSGTFSDLPTLEFLSLNFWRRLTSIEPNSFADLRLTDLQLQEFQLDINGLFTNSKIKNINLRSSRVGVLATNGLAGLSGTEQLNLEDSSLTSISAGAFNDFEPSANFNINLPNTISCCDVLGLTEMLTKMPTLTINSQSDTFVCSQPDKALRTINGIEDPTNGLPCCDFQTEYYDLSSNSCLVCDVTQNCAISNTTNCLDTKFECLECAPSFELSNDINNNTCTACNPQEFCGTSLSECVGDSEFTFTLKCDTCNDGYTTNGMGVCLSSTSSNSSSTTIVIISVSVVVGVSLVIVLLVFCYFRRRNKNKEKELLEFFGINEQQNLEMDLQTDEEYNEVLRRDNGEITLAESLASNASENDNKGGFRHSFASSITSSLANRTFSSKSSLIKKQDTQNSQLEEDHEYHAVTATRNLPSSEGTKKSKMNRVSSKANTPATLPENPEYYNQEQMFHEYLNSQQVLQGLEGESNLADGGHYWGGDVKTQEKQQQDMPSQTNEYWSSADKEQQEQQEQDIATAYPSSHYHNNYGGAAEYHNNYDIGEKAITISDGDDDDDVVDDDSVLVLSLSDDRIQTFQEANEYWEGLPQKK